MTARAHCVGVIISIHIPRTAGTTFREIASERLGGRLVHHYYRLMDHQMHPIEEIPADAEMIHGHVRPTQMLALYPHAALVTWLREPVARLISEYRFFRDHPDDANVLSKLVHAGGTFMDFVEHPGAVNRMTWYLDGLPLKRFSFIGITEIFDQELDRLERTLGLSFRRYHKVNQSSTSQVDLSVSERAHVEAINVADCRLYRSCMDLALSL
ncbi:MAG: sulfotransferase family 2 domain-containing protein [Opitutaceae bacterium]|nr:sulfotransferase family 2 domain-containing protein [Opitutaceae bacterium]